MNWGSSTLQWCENRLQNSWIQEPANTISNLGFIGIGILLGILVWKRSEWKLAPIPGAALLTGLASAYYHSHGTFFGEWLDFSAMFLLSGYGVAANIARWKKLSLEMLWAIYVVLVCLSALCMLVLHGLGIWIFVLHVVCAAVLEWKVRDRKTDYSPLGRLCIGFSLAYICWWMDYLKVICNPDNHWINGHSLWHLLNALSFYWIYRFYKVQRGFE